MMVLPVWLPPVLVLAVLAVLALAEAIWPDRPADRRRWPVNFGLGIVNAALVRIVGAVAPAGVALAAASLNIGLFNRVAVPPWGAIVAAILIMDLAIYWQHRALHRWRWGWTLHRLHHADPAPDVSTAVRFNPAEALTSMLYKGLITLALGPPLIAVLMFEVWLAAGSAIEHANIRLPARADGALRRWWVTPAMHRVHHSAHGQDHNHNYGFALAIWDHLFGTYRAAATGPQIGLPLRAPAG